MCDFMMGAPEGSTESGSGEAVFFVSSVILFDKYCHHMVLYGNYHICIFMNINENLINVGKTIA